jgi:hypothetical protein
MSSSIVLALRVFGVPGTAEVLVMAAALGLFLAATLWRPARRRHAIVLVDGSDSLRGVRRPRGLALLSSWPRPNRAQDHGEAVGNDPAAEPDKHAGIPVIGYATLSARAGEESDEELAKQSEIIARACERRGLLLLEVVREPQSGPGCERPGPGLRYALGRIAAGEAQGLVVPGLRRLTRSTAELGPIVEWFTRRRVRLVAVAQGLDTSEREGRLAARLLIEVSRWERERVGDPTRWGLPARSLGRDDLDEDLAEDVDDVTTVERSS